MHIEEMVNRILALGLDVGTKDAVRSALHFIGYDTKALDSIYIEVTDDGKGLNSDGILQKALERALSPKPTPRR